MNALGLTNNKKIKISKKINNIDNFKFQIPIKKFLF